MTHEAPLPVGGHAPPGRDLQSTGCGGGCGVAAGVRVGGGGAGRGRRRQPKRVGPAVEPSPGRADAGSGIHTAPHERPAAAIRSGQQIDEDEEKQIEPRAVCPRSRQVVGDGRAPLVRFAVAPPG